MTRLGWGHGGQSQRSGWSSDTVQSCQPPVISQPVWDLFSIITSGEVSARLQMSLWLPRSPLSFNDPIKVYLGQDQSPPTPSLIFTKNKYLLWDGKHLSSLGTEMVGPIWDDNLSLFVSLRLQLIWYSSRGLVNIHLVNKIQHSVTRHLSSFVSKIFIYIFIFPAYFLFDSSID